MRSSHHLVVSSVILRLNGTIVLLCLESEWEHCIYCREISASCLVKLGNCEFSHALTTPDQWAELPHAVYMPCDTQVCIWPIRAWFHVCLVTWSVSSMEICTACPKCLRVLKVPLKDLLLLFDDVSMSEARDSGELVIFTLWDYFSPCVTACFPRDRKA